MKTRKTTAIPPGIAHNGAWLLRFCFLLGIATFFGGVPDTFAQLEKGRVVSFVLHGRSLEANTTGDSADRKIQVYLPPGYDHSTQRYPVIYLLHGYKGGGDQWTVDPEWNIQTVMDKAIFGGLKPMMIVMPDAKTRAGGSFYVDSKADGQWETFISRELVEHIDGRFRTLASARSRAVAGHSMGGYGALYLGFRHPDIFSATYALSPSCLEFVGDLTLDSPEWRRVAAFRGFDAFQQEDHYLAQAFAAIAIAWSPDPSSEPFGADFPITVTDAGLKPRPEVVSRWNAHMIVPNVARDASTIRQLNAIGFDAGRSDLFTHIPLGEADLDRSLTSLGIKHRFELYEGDHNSGVPGRISETMLPFLAGALESKP